MCFLSGILLANPTLGSLGSFNAEKERARRDTQRRKSPLFSAYLCEPSLSLR
jgi:hypothetical protein